MVLSAYISIQGVKNSAKYICVRRFTVENIRILHANSSTTNRETAAGGLKIARSRVSPPYRLTNPNGFIVQGRVSNCQYSQLTRIDPESRHHPDRHGDDHRVHHYSPEIIQ